MSSVFLPFLAVRADTKKTQTVICYSEPCVICDAFFHLFQQIALKLPNGTAFSTNQVMMVMLTLFGEANLVAILPITIIKAVDNTELLQELQIAVYGCQTDIRVDFSGVEKNLFRRQMIVRMGDQHI